MTETLSFSAHVRRLLSLGLPLVGANTVGFLIHMTDMIMLGWYSVTSLAAATVATGIWFVTFIVGAGFGRAVTPLVAEATEQGDEPRARRATRMALWLSGIYAVLLIVPFSFGEELLLLIGQPADVAREGGVYLTITAFGLFPALASTVIRSYLGALELTAIQLWITLFGLIFNGVLNYALIFGNFGAPELGIGGAAIASVSVHIVMMVALILYTNQKRPDADLFARIWKPDFPAMKTVLRLGLPIGITAFAESGLFTGSSIMMGWMGEVELAAHGIAQQLTALMFMFHVGMSEAVTIRASRHYGARNETELRRGGLAGYAVSFGFGFMVVALFVTMPGFFVSLFLSPAEPARDLVLPLGITLLLISALFQFVDAAQIVGLALLRGVQDTRIPMWLAIISYWVIGLPAGYVMAFVWDLGAAGIWLGLTVGLAVAALTLSIRFWSRSVRLG